MPQKLPESVWNEIRTAYASGIGLREIARNLGIPEGTVLARAKREGWSKVIAEAKAKAGKAEPMQSNAITVAESAAITIAQRGQKYAEQMAGVAEKVAPHVQGMQPADILDRIEKVERFDRMARRTFGLDEESGRPSLVSITFLPPSGTPAPTIDIQADQL